MTGERDVEDSGDVEESGDVEHRFSTAVKNVPLFFTEKRVLADQAGANSWPMFQTGE